MAALVQHPAAIVSLVENVRIRHVAAKLRPRGTKSDPHSCKTHTNCQHPQDPVALSAGGAGRGGRSRQHHRGRRPGVGPQRPPHGVCRPRCRSLQQLGGGTARGAGRARLSRRSHRQPGANRFLPLPSFSNVSSSLLICQAGISFRLLQETVCLLQEKFCTCLWPLHQSSPPVFASCRSCNPEKQLIGTAADSVNLLLQPVRVTWEAGGRDSHELTGAFTPQLAGTCHLAVTYRGAHIQGAA